MSKVTGQDVVMGIQHTFIMFGATVLVPLLTGLNIGVTLFAAGIGTLIFHFVTKFQVPVYLGSSFAFIPPIIAVSQAEGIPEALGGIFIAGLIYILVAILFRFIKIEILHRILPSHVTGPMIILIGLILAPVAIENASGVNAQNVVDKIGVNGCWGVAFFTLSVSIFVKVFFAKIGKKLLSMLPVLLALFVGYIPNYSWSKNFFLNEQYLNLFYRNSKNNRSNFSFYLFFCLKTHFLK